MDRQLITSFFRSTTIQMRWTTLSFFIRRLFRIWALVCCCCCSIFEFDFIRIDCVGWHFVTLVSAPFVLFTSFFCSVPCFYFSLLVLIRCPIEHTDVLFRSESMFINNSISYLRSDQSSAKQIFLNPFNLHVIHINKYERARERTHARLPYRFVYFHLQLSSPVWVCRCCETRFDQSTQV